MVNLDTWIVSDTHFGHKNIVKYCNRPMDHNEIMKREWLKAIKPGEPVLHLGDVSVWYGPDMDDWHRKVSLLPGEKLLIKGNHDKLKPKVWEYLGFKMIPEFIQEFDGQRVLFSHYPDDSRIGAWDINIHGHIHNNGLDPVLAASKRRYINVSMEMMDYKPVRLGDIL
jgi:calcineurin-like phosphoesterase family protein